MKGISCLAAGSILLSGCSTPEEGVKTLWIYGINGSWSVQSANDVRPTVAFAVAHATSLNPKHDSVEVVKVFARSQVVLPAGPPPRGRDQTLKSWLNLLEPMPEPAQVLGTRSDLFWKRVAEKAKTAPAGTRVVGIMIGDGFAEKHNPKVFADADAVLSTLPNAFVVYAGTRRGSIEEIERSLSKTRGKGRLVFLPDIRAIKSNSARLQSLEVQK
jgi:hypothetical protein